MSLQQNKLLGAWVIVMGAVSGVIVVIKNVRVIVKLLFEVVETVQTKIMDSIDVLQKELEEDVTEIMEESLAADPAEDGSPDFATHMIIKSTVTTLSKGI